MRWPVKRALRPLAASSGNYCRSIPVLSVDNLVVFVLKRSAQRPLLSNVFFLSFFYWVFVLVYALKRIGVSLWLTDL